MQSRLPFSILFLLVESDVHKKPYNPGYHALIAIP